MATVLPSIASADPTTDVPALHAEIRWLRLQVQDLRQQLWGKSSERMRPDPTAAATVLSLALFEDVSASADAAQVRPTVSGPSRGGSGARPTGARRGVRPLDPTLPREVIALADPAPAERMCALSGAPLTRGMTEVLEVLARQPAQYYVKRYERTVWVSPLKTAPVYTPWPTDVLSRARVHASVVAHIAVAHYTDHLPFYRIEQQLARVGITLVRSSQVSLMQQLDARLAPLVDRIKTEVFASGYVHLDATPIDVCDPARPGRVREGTLWLYRAHTGLVWVEYATSKSPDHPHRTLLATHYQGVLQTDGAAGLAAIGPPGLTYVGCWAHARRYVFKAAEAGETGAARFLAAINRLFQIDRRAQHFGLSTAQRDALRARYSVPLVTTLFAHAEAALADTPPKTLLGKALHYLLAQRAGLLRCVTTSGACLDNNLAENAIRPLKLGAKNWLFVGHPDAGPRLANLHTVVENCRQAGVDPEAYLIDILGRLLDHPNRRLGELLPGPWQATRTLLASITL